MADTPVPRTPPDLSGLTGEFYEHCARGELRFQRCGDCGHWRHPPRFRCGECGSSRWSWEQSGRRGRVHTWTISHRAFDPHFVDALPYAILVVETDEGPRVVAGLGALTRDELALDLPVQLEFAPTELADVVLLAATRVP